MISGLLSGIFWGADTSFIGYYFSLHILGIGLPLIGLLCVSYIHDAVSAIAINLSIAFTGRHHIIIQDLKKHKSIYIMLGALLGGPIGMCSYIMSVYYIGPSLTAIISSIYPATGALFSYLFLKEKRKPYQIIALVIAILLSISIWYTNDNNEINFGIGIILALLCVCAWGSEAVLCSYGMQSGNISNVSAICIRQTVSALVYTGLFISYFIMIQDMGGLYINQDSIYIGIAAILGSISYYFYYQSLSKIGVIKTVALNISYTAFSTVSAYILFGYTLSIVQIIMGICIVLSGILSAYDFKK